MQQIFKRRENVFEFESQITIDALIDVFNKGNYSELIIRDDLMNSKFINDISFISQLPNLKVLAINCQCLKNYKPIAKLTNLETLRLIDAKDNLVDISNLNLTTIWVDDSRNIVGLDTCLKVEEFDSSEFNHFNFEALSNLVNLKKLVIHNSKIKNLKGLENTKKLESIDFRGCTKLSDLSQVSGLPIKEVKFLECPKINIDALENLPELRKVRIVLCKLKVGFLKRLKWRFRLEECIIN